MGKARKRRGLWVACVVVLAALALNAGAVQPPSAVAAACPNESFRTGSSARLPDCRAYELVTPPDSNGRQFRDVQFSKDFDMFPTEVATSDGGSLMFATYGSSLLDPAGGGGRVEYDVYEADRSASGWKTVRHVTPLPDEAMTPLPGGISADHAFIFTHVGPLEKIAGEFGSLYPGKDVDYLGDSSGSFELTGIGSLGSEPLAQGRYISPGGSHVIFTTGRATNESHWCAIAITNFGAGSCQVKRLEPEAAPTGTGTIYDRAADGSTQVVSLLPPGNVTPAAGQNAVYRGASNDGTVVAFDIDGVLYARVDSGSPTAATEKVTEESYAFAGISDDDRYLFHVSAGDVHRFNLENEVDSEVITSGDAEIVNISDDGSHIYFISHELLDGSSGTGGEPNLYVWSGSSPEYVTTVAPSDLESTSGEQTGVPALTNWTDRVTNAEDQGGPGADSSRATPDGSVLIFESRAQLTSYPNAGHTEIYRYDDGDKSLRCVSCNPLSTSPTADAHLQNLQTTGVAIVLHNLSDDGRRVFFETSEGLVGNDTDGINDVYEWQLPSEGGAAGLDLITGGESIPFPQVSPVFEDNVLFGITPDGSDVFFRSQDPLTPEAGTGGAPAIYDARIGGGFPGLSTPSFCAEEECRSPLDFAPSLGGAASSALHGAGNVAPRKKRAHKRKKKRHHCRRRAAQHKRCPGKRTPKAGLSSVGTGAPLPSIGSSSVPVEPEAASSGTPAGGGATVTTAAVGSGEFSNFGIDSVAAELSTATAAEHPDFTATVTLKHGSSVFSAKTQNVSVGLPPGLYGNPNLVPRCSTGDFLGESCSRKSQVGVTRVTLIGIGETIIPIFNLVPPHPDREVARFGFTIVGSLSVFIDVSVRTATDYGIAATVHGAPSPFPVAKAETTFWGNPSDPSHDALRMTAGEARDCNAPCGGSNPSEISPIAFMTNPSACQGQKTSFSVTSYQLPGQVFGASAPMEPIAGCQGVPFAPSFEAHPTNRRAGAPTGLETVLKLPQSSDPAVRSTATMREAKVTLPEGMGISSSAADGIAACSEEQVHLHQELNADCPEASKLGTAKIISPALPEPLEGAIFQRTPERGHQFRLWLVTDQLGLHVKLPGEVKPDPLTGQLTAVFSDLPQVPVEEIDFDIWGGPRAPLKNPDSCGTYATAYSFAPHSSDPPVFGQTAMTIDEGCGGGAFSPQLHGGVTNPIAGIFSPFVMDLVREDGEQGIAQFEATLPKGELAKLKGVPLCPDADAVTGACPAGSKVGSLAAAVGVGPNPLWLPQPGKEATAIYLSGPYKGAPYSVVAVVPAQAGPFDLGDVVVRSALIVNPETAQVTVKTDPLPGFVEGVPAIYRRLHVVVDRPGFTLNPTNCSELALSANVMSTNGAIANPSERFQVDGCRGLGFRPKLSLSLKGGTKRGQYPALKATLKARGGDANLGRVSVALPHSEFLAQEHIVTICTRVQFAAHKCPNGAIYGKAKAWTPLLDKPIEGPVYLRSSDHPLPDLVLDLEGQIDIAVPGRIDSKNGGIRTTFEAVPDAPISKVVLKMKGGQKGLLSNSQNICVGDHRATVRMRAQNGRVVRMGPPLEAGCKT